MSRRNTVSWNNAFYGVEIKSAKKHFIVSAMPNMTGRLDAAVKCCETMGNWRLPTFKEMEMIADSIPRINALMDENGGHRIDLESILWLAGTMGIHAASMLAKVSATYSSIVRIHCPGGGTGGSFGWSCLSDETSGFKRIS